MTQTKMVASSVESNVTFNQIMSSNAIPCQGRDYKYGLQSCNKRVRVKYSAVAVCDSGLGGVTSLPVQKQEPSTIKDCCFN